MNSKLRHSYQIPTQRLSGETELACTRKLLAGAIVAAALIASAALFAAAYEDQPLMIAALQNLREAEQSLQRADPDKGGHRVKAIELIREAQREVQAGIEYDNTHTSPGERAYDRDRDDSRWRSRLSPADQEQFDKYYDRWLDDRRKNDRDDIENMERRMRDVMSRYHISPDVPFDQIASNGHVRYDGDDHRRRERLSPADQEQFDKYYDRWLDDHRKNDSDDITNMERRMHDMMSRYSIPPEVPFEQITSRR
jgi:hypothetical protein